MPCPCFQNMWGFSFWVDVSKGIRCSWCWCSVVLEPTDNLSSFIQLAVGRCTETMDNAFCIPTYLLFSDINWDALLSFHDNYRPSVPSNKIPNLLMDMQQSDIQNRAYITTCLVLAKAAQKLDRKSIWSQKGREKHMPGLVLMDEAADCGNTTIVFA